MIKRRQETRPTILKQLVKRPPRDARARHDVRDRHITDAPLAHKRHHRTQNPRALQLTDPPPADTTDETRAIRVGTARAVRGTRATSISPIRALRAAAPRAGNRPGCISHRQHRVEEAARPGPATPSSPPSACPSPCHACLSCAFFLSLPLPFEDLPAERPASGLTNPSFAAGHRGFLDNRHRVPRRRERPRPRRTSCRLHYSPPAGSGSRGTRRQIRHTDRHSLRGATAAREDLHQRPAGAVARARAVFEAVSRRETFRVDRARQRRRGLPDRFRPSGTHRRRDQRARRKRRIRTHRFDAAEVRRDQREVIDRAGLQTRSRAARPSAGRPGPRSRRAAARSTRTRCQTVRQSGIPA